MTYGIYRHVLTDEPLRPATRQESITGKVARFFNENPGEMLTWDDAATKFGCTKDQVRWAIASLKRRRLVRVEVVSVLRAEDGA